MGLCAAVLLAWAVPWRSWDLPAPGQDIDGRQEETTAGSEPSPESALTDSPEAAEAADPPEAAEAADPPEADEAADPPEADEAAGSLWVEVDESTLAVLPPYFEEWSTEGRALVEVPATDWLWAAQVGDQLALPVPQLGTTLRSVVDEIDEGAGARALVGTITDGDGDRRRSVVTVGPTSLFAFIDTPNGTYEFEIDLDLHQHGWLVPTSSMLAGWDFSEPDVFIDPDGDGDGVGDVNERIAGTNPDDSASKPGESTVDIGATSPRLRKAGWGRSVLPTNWATSWGLRIRPGRARLMGRFAGRGGTIVIGYGATITAKLPPPVLYRARS